VKQFTSWLHYTIEAIPKLGDKIRVKRRRKTMTIAVTTPEWVKDAIFYQIFPDRFAKSERVRKPANLQPWEAPPTAHGFKGGDLLGVLERLDYLSELGIDAIYLNPIFQSASNHRYHTHDYYRVDPLLGGDAAFRQLLAEAHQRGIKIVLDGVFNHASRGFFQFNHILECGAESPYLHWFTVKDFPLHAYEGRPNYECWVNLPALPKFNTRNPQVRDFLFDVARYWLEQGIDGWRLDVPFEIDDDTFWREFRQVVKEANPQAYIVGEVIHEAQRWLQGDQFDAVMNYQFTQAVLGYCGGKHIDREMERHLMGLPRTPVLDAPAFARRVEALLRLYPSEIVAAQMNLLDSHDMPRFISLVGGDQAALRLAVLFQMTYPGAPCIYYGDEIGLSGGSSRMPEPSRSAFPWQPQRWDAHLLEYYKRCIALRKAHPALRRGEFISLQARGQVYVYLRRLAEETLLVALNAGDAPEPLDLPTGERLAPEGRWRDLLSGGSAYAERGNLHGLALPPRGGVVLIEG
jgi:cyclomaltodextrinase